MSFAFADAGAEVAVILPVLNEFIYCFGISVGHDYRLAAHEAKPRLKSSLPKPEQPEECCAN